MRPTRNSLSESVRKTAIQALQARLADALTLASHAKQAHWTVRGPRFHQLHELFDSVHEEASGQADDLAERIAALGGDAQGTVRHAADQTTLPAWPEGAVGGDAVLHALADSQAAFANHLRAGIGAVGGDAVTEDLFTGMAGDADKTLWMIEAHLHDGS